MPYKNSIETYGVVSRFLHWFIALAMVAMFALGWYATELDFYDPNYHRALNWHKSFGVLFACLIAIKLFWTLANNKTALLSMPQWQRYAAIAVHYLLAALQILIPVSGYLISTGQGDAIDVFGWFSVPAIWKFEVEAVEDVHGWLAYSAACLVVLHVAAALKHHFMDKDATLLRMLTGATTRK